MAGHLPAKDSDNASSMQISSLPGLFSQSDPLDSSALIKCAHRRGVDLSELKLRQLYRRGLLMPFVAITSQRRCDPQTYSHDEPKARSTLVCELRKARETGRLFDPSDYPFLPRLRFTSSGSDTRGVYSGLLYSRRQLIILPILVDQLAQWRYSYRNGVFYPLLPEPEQHVKDWASSYQRIALMATALESRYLPVVQDSELFYLVDATHQEYLSYQESFDPVEMSRQLRYPPAQILADAECLLRHAHGVDPTEGPWRRLLAYAPRRSWEHLKDAALSAMDLRETAEILLKFYEDLVRLDAAPKLVDTSKDSWHPMHERLTAHPGTLDQELTSLGLSPHPRVLLALEGETEEYHARLVQKKLEFTSGIVRLIKLGGTDKDPVKIAGLAATPLVVKKEPDHDFWWVNRPPTRFVVAADPEGRYAPTRLPKTRRLILDEIRAGLAVQGARAAESELNELVELNIWDSSCYEYAHFTDAELAAGIAVVHETCNSWSGDELISALAYWRAKKRDIKCVWESGRWDPDMNRPSGKWDYEVSKLKLAEALWPTLERKIELALDDPCLTLPPIASILSRAYKMAQIWKYGPFMLFEPGSAG